MYPTQVPVLESERLRLRAPGRADFPSIARLWSTPAVVRYIGGKPASAEESWARLLRNAGHWALMSYGLWVVEARDSHTFLGEVGLINLERDIEPSLGGMPEVGWVLLPEAHGRGFATEAVRAALAWMDANLAYPRSVCIISPDNEPSLKLARKCGFRHLTTGHYHDGPIEIFARPRGG